MRGIWFSFRPINQSTRPQKKSKRTSPQTSIEKEKEREGESKEAHRGIHDEQPEERFAHGIEGAVLSLRGCVQLICDVQHHHVRQLEDEDLEAVPLPACLLCDGETESRYRKDKTKHSQAQRSITSLYDKRNQRAPKRRNQE